ncbi:MAG: multiheme c-type cytochrome [bacterium]
MKITPMKAMICSLCIGVLCTPIISIADEGTLTKELKELPAKVKSFVSHGLAPKTEPMPHMQTIDEEKLPFPPMFVTTNKGQEKLTELDFEDPSVCAGCHPKQYEGWKTSMHANSFKDPVYQALWDLGEKETNGGLMNECGICHSPIGTLTGATEHDKKAGKFTSSKLGEQGVSCDVCHTISKSNFLQTTMVEHGNASFHIAPEGPGGTKRGPFSDAVSPYHKTAKSDLHTKADFCGNCHQIFNSKSGFPVERTYDEWKYSAYARKGIVCQDCHMNEVDVAVKVAQQMKTPDKLKGVDLSGKASIVSNKVRKVVHKHEFVGGNMFVPKLLHGENNKTSEEAIKRLQSAAELSLKVAKRKDGLTDLRVTVKNVGSGHNLPTSLTDVREVWVEVVVKDRKGKIIYSNGVMDKHRSLNYDDVTMFRSVAIDDKGKETHKPWEVMQFVSNTSIPPKGHSTSKYIFSVPKKAGKVTIEVRLNYRSYPQHLANELFGEGKVQIPVVEMAKKKLTM